MENLFITTFLAILASLFLCYASSRLCKQKKKLNIFSRAIIMCFVFTCFTVVPNMFYGYYSSNIRDYEGYYVEFYEEGDSIWNLAICDINYRLFANKIEFSGYSYNKNGNSLGNWTADVVIFNNKKLRYLYGGESERDGDKIDRTGTGYINFSSINEGDGGFKSTSSDDKRRKIRLYKVRNEESIKIIKESKSTFAKKIFDNMKRKARNFKNDTRVGGNEKELYYEKLKEATIDFL